MARKKIVIEKQKEKVEQQGQEVGKEQGQDEEGIQMEIKQEEQIPAKPLPNRIDSLKNDVEVYEIRNYFIKATNKPDARLALETYISSQDIIMFLNSTSGGYDGRVNHLVLREDGRGE